MTRRAAADPPQPGLESSRPGAPRFWRKVPVFRDHPPGLGVCFLVEMWERFSYYGMRALLIFYLTQHFLFSDSQAFLLYGAYASMVYLLPVLGGAVADGWLGPRKGVTFGALLLVAGHFLMTIEGPAAEEVSSAGGLVVERSDFHLSLFYLALALIATGVGFLKTNASTVVGALYEQGDPRRDSGFTVFYMGINLGAAVAPLLCGWLGQTYGWRYGFGLAGVGMLAGLLLYLRGQKVPPGPCGSAAARRTEGARDSGASPRSCHLPWVPGPCRWRLVGTPAPAGRRRPAVGHRGSAGPLRPLLRTATV